MRKVVFIVLMVSSVLLFASDNEVVGTECEPMPPSNADIELPLLWALNVQGLGIVDSVWNLGVEFYGDHYVIITEGQAILEFHVIDLLDSTNVGDFPQTGAAAGWGYRDMCKDAGDTIYCSDNIMIHGFVFDTLAMTMTSVNNYTGQSNPNRALAYVPGDTFWTGTFSSNLGWFTKFGSTGNGVPSNSVYGAAYCPLTGTIWYHGQVTNPLGWDCNWFEYDPVTNNWTGNTFYCAIPSFAAGYVDAMAGGGCYVDDFFGTPVLIGLCQGDNDFIYAIDLSSLAVEENPNPISGIQVLDISEYNSIGTSLQLSVRVPSLTNIEFKIYDASGKLVANPFNGAVHDAHILHWNADDVANGIYIYQIVAGDKTASGKFTVVH